MRLSILSVVLVVGGMAGLAPRSCWGGEATTRPAELRVLERYIGTRDIEYSFEPVGAAPIRGRTSVTGKWVLQGAFLQEDYRGEDGSLNRTVMMSFDERARAYVLWAFDTSGAWGESRGNRDARERALTWRSKYSTGIEGTGTERHVDENNGIETAVFKNPKGEIVARGTMAAKRRKG